MKQKKYLVSKFKLLTSFFFLFAVTLIFNVNAQKQNKLIAGNYKVYTPDGTGPFPVAIVIPGCSGVSLQGSKTDIGRPGYEDDKLFKRHWPFMAQRLVDSGYLVLIIDYLAAENVINTCSGEIPYKKVTEYITESISFVKTITKTDTTRINIIGASYGGTSVLTWLETVTNRSEEIQSIITIYPGCRRFLNVWDTPIPLLMILGKKDDIAPPEFCTELIEKLPGNTNVRVKIYPDARHGFDLTEGPSVLPIGNGKTVGKNVEAGNDAWKEIISFLNEKK